MANLKSPTVIAPSQELLDDNRVVDAIIVLGRDWSAIIPEKGANKGKLIISNPDGEVVDIEEVTGRIMLRQENSNFGLGKNSYLNTEKRVFFQAGRIPELRAIIEEYGLAEGVSLPKHKIIVKESHSPFFDGQIEKQYPESSDYAGEPVLSGGEPVYRQTLLLPKASPELDEYLPTDPHGSMEAVTASAEEFEAQA